MISLFNFNYNFSLQDEHITELPKFICEQCLKALVIFIGFKAKCEIRDQELRENIRAAKLRNGDQLTVTKSEMPEFVFEECLIKSELPIEEEYEIYNENTDWLDLTESDSRLSDVDSLVENTKLDTHQCLICHKKFDNFLIFNQHKKIHKNCPDCGKKYEKYSELLKHRSIVHRKKRNYSCLICFKEFKGWLEINEHNRTEHLNCPECSKKCISYKAMAAHRKNSHYRNDNLKCEFCEKTFKFRGTLKIHKRRVHAKELNHKCEHCGKEFFEISTLKVHLKIHSVDRAKKTFSCDFLDCNYTDTNLGNLKTHKKVHITFSCDFLNCDFSPKNLSCLKKHKQIHENIPQKEKKVKDPVISKKKQVNPKDSPICPYCGKSFTKKSGLDLHIRIHLNEKPYQCEFCEKKFSDSSSLRSHRRVHTDERPYPCDLCEKKFKNSNNLKDHKTSAHETEKKFVCNICGKATKISHNLHKHMKNVHNIERITKKSI